MTSVRTAKSDSPVNNAYPIPLALKEKPAVLFGDYVTNNSSRKSQYQQTTRVMRRPMAQSTDLLFQANRRTEPVQRPIKAESPKAVRPEPARQPSTYIVPQRSRARGINRMSISTAPLFVLLLMLGMLIAMGIAMINPSMTVLLSPAIIAFAKVLFMMVAFCSAIALIFALFNYQTV